MSAVAGMDMVSSARIGEVRRRWPNLLTARGTPGRTCLTVTSALRVGHLAVDVTRVRVKVVDDVGLGTFMDLYPEDSAVGGDANHGRAGGAGGDGARARREVEGNAGAEGGGGCLVCDSSVFVRPRKWRSRAPLTRSFGYPRRLRSFRATSSSVW